MQREFYTILIRFLKLNKIFVVNISRLRYNERTKIFIAKEKRK